MIGATCAHWLSARAELLLPAACAHQTRLVSEEVIQEERRAVLDNVDTEDAEKNVLKVLEIPGLCILLVEALIVGTQNGQKAAATVLYDLSFSPRAVRELVVEPRALELLFDVFLKRPIQGIAPSMDVRLLIAGVCWNISVPRPYLWLVAEPCSAEELLDLVHKSPTPAEKGLLRQLSTAWSDLAAADCTDLRLAAVAILSNVARWVTRFRNVALRCGAPRVFGDMLSSPCADTVRLGALAAQGLLVDPEMPLTPIGRKAALTSMLLTLRDVNATAHPLGDEVLLRARAMWVTPGTSRRRFFCYAAA